MDQRIIELIIANSPAVIGMLQGLWKAKNPGEPEPTPDEIIVGLHAWAKGSIAKDDAWDAAHPKKPTLRTEE